MSTQIHPLIDAEFKLLRFLGGGEYAKVYLVLEHISKKKCVLKVVQGVPFLKGRDHLKHEFDVLGSLSHPSIPQAYNYKEFPDVSLCFFTQEYFEGKPLHQCAEIADGTKVGSIIRMAAELIEYIHSQGFAHGDLKPEHILVFSKETQVHVGFIDFSICQPLTQTAPTRAGTWQYLAPEALKGDIRFTDWYALGLSLKACLGNSAQEKFKDVLEGLAQQDLSQRLKSLGEVSQVLEGPQLKKTPIDFKDIFQQAHRFQAVELHRQGKWRQAIQAYDELLGSLEDSFVEPQIWGLKALALVSLGEPQTAIDLLSPVVGQIKTPSAEYFQIYNALGLAQKVLGNLDAAIGHLETALKLSEKVENKMGQAQVLNNLAQALQGQNILGRAAKCYEQAVCHALNAGDIHLGLVASLNQGTLADQRGEYGVAIVAYEQAHSLAQKLNLAFESGIAEANYWHLLGRLGHVAKALDEIGRLKIKYEVVCELVSHLKLVEAELQVLAGIEPHFEDLSLLPNRLKLYADLQRLDWLTRLGDWEKAYVFLQAMEAEILASGLDDVQAMFLLKKQKIQTILGKLKEADELLYLVRYFQTKERFEMKAEALFWLGMFWKKSGDSIQAQKAHGDVLQLLDTMHASIPLAWRTHYLDVGSRKEFLEESQKTLNNVTS